MIRRRKRRFLRQRRKENRLRQRRMEPSEETIHFTYKKFEDDEIYRPYTTEEGIAQTLQEKGIVIGRRPKYHHPRPPYRKVKYLCHYMGVFVFTPP